MYVLLVIVMFVMTHVEVHGTELGLSRGIVYYVISYSIIL